MAGVQLEHVVREYIMGKTTIRAVDDISFTIPEGKYTIILGASGAGKSTVLNIPVSYTHLTLPTILRV